MQVVECAHFLYRLSRRPALERDAVSSDEHAAAVTAQPTVDKYGSAWALQNQIKKLSNLFILGCCPTGPREIDEAYVERFSATALIQNQAVKFAAQVNDCINTEPLQFPQSVDLGLAAAVKEIVNLAKIRNARYAKFFGKCALTHSRRLILSCTAAGRSSRGKQGEGDRNKAVG